MKDILKTGTTTLGLVCKEGVVLAADRRITVGGNFIIGDTKKIIPIGDRFAITIAGGASDAIMLSRYLKAEVKLKELRSKNEVTTREAANLLAQWVFGNVRQPSMIQPITHFLFAGRDNNGVELYDIFPDGSINEIPKYFCSGSGSVFAYGLIDAEYKEGMSIEETKKLAKRAIQSAIKRDAASGNGYDIIAITNKKLQEVESKVFENQITE